MKARPSFDVVTKAEAEAALKPVCGFEIAEKPLDCAVPPIVNVVPA